MKVIIAGSRHFHSYSFIKERLDAYFSKRKPSEIVCGCCEGVDMAGKQYAIENGIPIKYFPANWYKHGKAAGPIRNKEMAEYADCLVLFWDGISHGSRNMLYIAKKTGLNIREVSVPKMSGTNVPDDGAPI